MALKGTVACTRRAGALVAALSLLLAPAGLPAVRAASSSVPAAASNEAPWLSVACPGMPRTASPGTQAMDGKIKVCVQVPEVPGGEYHLFLRDIVEVEVPHPQEAPEPRRVPGGPPVSLRAVPLDAVPGQVVTLTGTVAAPLARRPEFANFCWDGCPHGLRYFGVALRWRSARTFSAQVTLPSAPWLQTGTDKVVSPLPGAYPLGVQCLVNGPLCSLNPSEGQVTVHLVRSARYTCQSVPTCVRLTVTPAVSVPDAVVAVTGYAPLQSATIDGQSLFANFAGERGGPSRRGVASSRSPNGFQVEVDMGRASVRVEPAPTFASLGQFRPLAEQAAGEPLITSTPPSRLSRPGAGQAMWRWSGRA